jgi:hypothetical protein
MDDIIKFVKMLVKEDWSLPKTFAALWKLQVLRASPAVLSTVYDPAKIFLTSKFSYLMFWNPTHKTETETTNRWGTTNSKPLGPIIMTVHKNTQHLSDHIYYTLFCRSTTLLGLLLATANCVFMLS